MPSRQSNGEPTLLMAFVGENTEVRSFVVSQPWRELPADHVARDPDGLARPEEKRLGQLLEEAFGNEDVLNKLARYEPHLLLQLQRATAQILGNRR
jgi:hypothetical protein